ncbi:hypothetical protein ACVRWL_08255 [Streptococcus ratti]|uniref:Uncharacterized protein n=1 Tax=Streptococcus ratti TaxID=1341 RepID=A0A7X9LEY7_STRRT|nr:hypothetical protein [Streptococcus ratti]NMD49627.1 hypothetical protein [Streptococcus ratti]
MKKIDLHIHTQACKQGDGKKRRISPEDFVKKMKENNVEVCSITNHNKFDIEEFNQIQSIDNELTIFPGMEIDVDFPDNQHRHVIVVVSPDKKEQFDTVFDEPSRDYDSFKIDYKEFISKVKIFSNSEIIVIPHFYLKDKDRGVTVEEAERLRDDLEGYIVILEPKSLQAMGIINSHNDLALFGSDVKDWSKYDEIVLPEIKYKVDTFAKFYKLAENPSLFIKSMLEDTKSYSVLQSDAPQDYKELTQSVEIFEDINIIFGEKGSGKTIFVKNYIFPTLKNLGKDVFLHEGKDYKIEYQTIIDELGNKVVIDEELIGEISDVIESILNYSELNKYDGLQKIVDFRSSELKNKNAARIYKRDARVSASAYSEDIQSVLSKTKSSFKKIDDVIKINNETKRIKIEEQSELNNRLNSLKKDILTNSKEQIQQAFSNKGIINSIDSIKESIKKQTGTDSGPTHLGFAELVRKRLNRIKNNERLLSMFQEVEEEQVNKLGVLPQKGEVKLKTEIKVLTEDETYRSDSGFDRNGIVSRRALIKKFNHFNMGWDFHNINAYFNAEEKQTDIDDFVSKIIKRFNTVVLIDNNGGQKGYSPSEGEQAILSISAILENNQHDFYIFDEIERGLGNYYISSYLIPKIKELRDRGKTIIISTHNANIAINTLPSQTIYCDYDFANDLPVFYVGNMYSNQLINANSKSLKWEDIALKHLEGSEEMFTNRRDIYGI